tara:strand:- start:77 stop:661 length:585 start_codon:yes stop_codon:yes gene_type:complete
MDGLYWIELKPSISRGDFNEICVSGRGHLEVYQQAISGSIVTDQILTFDIQATVNNTGIIAGGLALGRGEVTSFNGKMDDIEATGQWEFANGCRGTWQATPGAKHMNDEELTKIYHNLERALCEPELLSCLSESADRCSGAFQTSLNQCYRLLKSGASIKLNQHIGECISVGWFQQLQAYPQSFSQCVQPSGIN